jgi:hypothetical protein
LNPEEIKKLTMYFRAKFENAQFTIRKLAQKSNSAEVYLGDNLIGALIKDEEDGETSYNFSMAISAQPLSPDEINRLTLYFRAKFENPQFSVRKRPQKSDSVEVYLGEEFIGVLYKLEADGKTSYDFDMAILDIDLG